MKIVRNGYEYIIDKDKLLKVDKLMCNVFLMKKLLEESQEIIDSKAIDVYEYADLLQVMIDLGNLNNISFNDIIEAAQDKEERLGTFSEGIILND